LMMLNVRCSVFMRLMSPLIQSLRTFLNSEPELELTSSEFRVRACNQSLQSSVSDSPNLCHPEAGFRRRTFRNASNMICTVPAFQPKTS
jgi:hypothetical protein